jgi:deoxyribonuclease-4
MRSKKRPAAAPLLGAHFSIAGRFTRAIDEAAELSCNALQIFTKSQRQWAARPIEPGEAEEFRNQRKERGILSAFAHASYLINLCAGDGALHSRSIDAMAEELERAELLGLDFVVVHPGSPGADGEKAGLDRMKKALRRIHAPRRCRILVETSAGQGDCVGWKFEHLAELLEASEDLGVCFDTCHVFAAGYDLASEGGYDRVMEEFDRVVGLDRLLAFHVNDSVQGLDSRVDRHERIGRGKIGLECFRRLMTDERMDRVPKVLETPKEDAKKRPMDIVNLKLLRGLAGAAPCPK